MFNKAFKSGLLPFVAVLASASTTALADNINTSGVICQNFNAREATDIDYLTTGVRNLAASSRDIICAIPRSPLNSPPSPTFYVDGHNNAGTSTTCTVTVYSFGGIVRSTQTFTENGGTGGLTWDFPVTLSPQPDFFDYASLLCLIPASIGGSIFGVTAVQP